MADTYLRLLEKILAGQRRHTARAEETLPSRQWRPTGEQAREHIFHLNASRAFWSLAQQMTQEPVAASREDDLLWFAATYARVESCVTEGPPQDYYRDCGKELRHLRERSEQKQ